ncbi:MAG: hypothetical protein QOF48_1276 [Verrucomicrobiota bacterium]|jgi:hypothetical protein
MKIVPVRATLAILVAVFSLALPASLHSQVDKVKEKAKDLKKELEGGQSKTNKPPAKTPPLPPKPAK